MTGVKHCLPLLTAVCLFLAGGALALSRPSPPSAPGTGENALPETLLSSYYLSQEDPVSTYLQNNSIRRFWDMWSRAQLGEDARVRWAYDTLAPVRLLDQELHALEPPGQTFYSCAFSTDDGRCGDLIVSYGVGGEGPYLSKWRLAETTPRAYDLRTNGARLAAALRETDIDLATASASRAERIDAETGHEDSLILFTDGTGGLYLCDLEEEPLTVKPFRPETA